GRARWGRRGQLGNPREGAPPLRPREEGGAQEEVRVRYALALTGPGKRLVQELYRVRIAVRDPYKNLELLDRFPVTVPGHEALSEIAPRLCIVGEGTNTPCEVLLRFLKEASASQ